MEQLRDDLQCRLCSARSGLISLFDGKNKQIRNYIRKLALEIVGVQYKEDGYFNCICASCVIQLYNMYVFIKKSLENQEKLQASFRKSTNHKNNATKLSDINLPDYSELKTIIQSWLLSKLDSNPQISIVDKNVQTEEPKVFNVSIQTALDPINRHKNSEAQTDLTYAEQKFTQCEIVKVSGTFEASTQTSLNFHNGYDNKRGSRKNHSVHNDLSIIKSKNRIKNVTKGPGSLNEHFSVHKNNKNKSSFSEEIEKKPNDDSRPAASFDKTKRVKIHHNHISTSANKITSQTNIEATNNKECNENTKSKDITQNSDNLREKESPKYKKSKEIPQDISRNRSSSSIKRKKRPSDIDISQHEEAVKTDSSNNSVVQRFEDRKAPLTIECQRSDPLLSDIKVERISPVETVLKTSPTFTDDSTCLSPPFPGLLQVTGKVEYLKACEECARLIYTKTEMMRHKKSHLICSVCKKKFSTITKTKEHMKNKCIKKLCADNPDVVLVRIEDSEQLRTEHPNILLQLKSKKKIK